MNPREELFSTPFRYKLYVTEILDGDTIAATIDMGMNVWKVSQTCRLNGIYAPPDNTNEGLLAKAELYTAVDVLGLNDDRTNILGKLFIAEIRKPEFRKIQHKYEKGIFVDWLVDLYGCTDAAVVHLNKHLLSIPTGSVFNEYR